MNLETTLRSTRRKRSPEHHHDDVITTGGAGRLARRTGPFPHPAAQLGVEACRWPSRQVSRSRHPAASGQARVGAAIARPSRVTFGKLGMQTRPAQRAELVQRGSVKRSSNRPGQSEAVTLMHVTAECLASFSSGTWKQQSGVLHQHCGAVPCALDGRETSAPNAESKAGRARGGGSGRGRLARLRMRFACSTRSVLERACECGRAGGRAGALRAGSGGVQCHLPEENWDPFPHRRLIARWTLRVANGAAFCNAGIACEVSALRLGWLCGDRGPGGPLGGFMRALAALACASRVRAQGGARSGRGGAMRH